MFKIFFRLFAFLCVLTYITSPKEAFSKDSDAINFSVNEKFLYFEKSEKPIKNITITNFSESTPLYIKGNIKKIDNDNLEDPTLIDTKEIIITPKNAIINPKESATFRIVYLPTTSQKENQYQVLFTPFDKDFKNLYADDVFVVTAIADPLIVKDDLTITRDKENITFKNSGNRSVFIYDAKSCDKQFCDKLLDIRIPQNTELKLNIEKNKKFECIQKIGTEYKKINVKF